MLSAQHVLPKLAFITAGIYAAAVTLFESELDPHSNPPSALTPHSHLVVRLVSEISNCQFQIAFSVSNFPASSN
jgi:hypothetical protein